MGKGYIVFGPDAYGLVFDAVSLELVEKVRRGAPVIMGTTLMVDRGRMPVFDYLTNDEAAAAYLYLVMYPPR